MGKFRHVGGIESGAAMSSYTDTTAAYMDYDSTAGTGAANGYAQFGAKGGGSIGLKLRTLLAGVATVVLTFTAAGAATFASTVDAAGITSTVGNAVAVTAKGADGRLKLTPTSGTALKSWELVAGGGGIVGESTFAVYDSTLAAVAFQIAQNTSAATFRGGITVQSGGVSITAGGLTVTAGGISTTSLTAATPTFTGDVQVNKGINIGSNVGTSPIQNLITFNRLTNNDYYGLLLATAGTYDFIVGRNTGGTSSDFMIYNMPLAAVGFSISRATNAATFGSSITTAAPTGGAGAWKLGIANAVSPTSPNRTVTIDIGGTAYYLAAKTTND